MKALSCWLEEKWASVCMIHPLGTTNICADSFCSVRCVSQSVSHWISSSLDLDTVIWRIYSSMEDWASVDVHSSDSSSLSSQARQFFILRLILIRSLRIQLLLCLFENCRCYKKDKRNNRKLSVVMSDVINGSGTLDFLSPALKGSTRVNVWMKISWRRDVRFFLLKRLFLLGSVFLLRCQLLFRINWIVKIGSTFLIMHQTGLLTS